jgi:hypothetical protein
MGAPSRSDIRARSRMGIQQSPARPQPTHIADEPESVATLSRRRLIPVDWLWLTRVEHSL